MKFLIVMYDKCSMGVWVTIIQTLVSVVREVCGAYNHLIAGTCHSDHMAGGLLCVVERQPSYG